MSTHPASEDVPSQSAEIPSGPIILKACSGPHRGAEMLLERGRQYVIGSGMAADIVISDSLVQDRHLVLVAGAQMMTVTACDGDVMLDGEVLSVDGSAEAGTSGVIAIGSTHFAFGHRDTLSAALQAADFQKRISTEQAATPETLDDTGAVLQTPAAQHTEGSKRRKGLYLAAALATFATFVVIVFSQSPQPLEPAGGSLVKRVESAVTGLSIAARSIVALPDGSVQLRGYVNSEEERRQVLERVDSFGTQVALQLWSDEGLIDASNRVLTSLGMAQKVAAVSSNRGVVVFRGNIDSRDTWDKALSALHEDLAGISKVRDRQVVTVAQRTEQVRDAIAQSFPEAGLSVAKVGNEIFIRGTVEEAETNGLTRLVDRVRSDLEGGPTLHVQVATTQEQLIKLDIRWVSRGANPYVLTTNGNRYMQGGRLDNGYMIESIEADRLILSKDGRKTDFLL